MNCVVRWTALLAGLAVATGVHAADQRRALSCNNGPVQRTFGNTDWFVLSCSDKRTLIIYSMPDNPASPAYFMWEPKGKGGIQVRGSEIGDKKATLAALRALKALSAKDAAALVDETRRAARDDKP